MGDQKLLLILSQSFLGTGFFFLYVYHVRSIFESRTNIEHGEQLERESLLRRDDALYYSFYKTLTEGDFWAGYEKLRNVTDIEYPNSVNVLKRFHVLPELGIAYLYHLWRYYAQSPYIPFLSCWRSSDVRLPMELRECDTAGQAMQFYLEFVWILGGFTVLTIYLYGTLLSYNVFGGVYAVVSYAMFHSCYAAKIYDRPVARENFAFPFILLQMFHLCMRMNRTGKRKSHKSRLIFIYNQIILTTIPLLCWQFSSVIFASQILIMMTPWSFNPNMPSALNTLTTDYSLSQLIANALGFYLSFGNKKYAFAWQVGPAISLLFISLGRRLKNQETSPPQENLQMQSIKTTAMGLILAASAQSCFTDLLEKSGLVRSSDNSFTLYRDLLLHWILQAKSTFATSLAACNSAYERMVWTDLWELVKTLIVKPYCLYGVVMLAKFFRKWRKNDETKNPSEEFQERMRKYVLEDFLETNHVSMSDLSNKETEELLNQCLELLSQCNFDYDQYKKKKAQQSKGNDNEHKEFMNDIRNLKKRINALNRKSKEESVSSSEQTTIIQNDVEENTEEQHPETPKLQRKSSKNKQTDDENPPSTNSVTSNGIGKSNSDVPAASQRETLEFHYVYSFIQLVVFTALGLCVRKLFFLSFTLGCIIAPTMCSKFCFRNQRDIFWTISLTVFLTSIVNPGLVNIREEYYPHSPNGNDDLDTMLQWIKMNTEKGAVFAGPIDIIGTVHLTTKRPIVNHAHLEMRQISERTEYVYSVFSRQQSSDVYNQCSQLKIQYLIVSLKDCINKARDECDLLFIWDDMQPAYRKYPQFCSEIVNKNIPSFLKVFSNEHFTIIKMFSQSVQISLRRSKMSRMPELAI